MRIKKSFILLCVLAFASTLTNKAYVASLFSPEDKPQKKLIELIDNARSSIHVAMYLLCDQPIADALVRAKNRRLDVRLFVDRLSTEKYGKANFLVENGIEVYVFNPKTKPPTPQKDLPADNRWFFNGPIMHNKFAIIDGVTLWTGSFNWTGAANNVNCENVIITDDRDTCRRYEQHFEELIIFRGTQHKKRIKQRSAPVSLRDTVIAALKKTNDDATLLEALTALLGQETKLSQVTN